MIASSFSWFWHTGLISPVLVLSGWWVVYQNAKRLATRAETKVFIDELIKTTSDMEKVAVDYWLAGRKERTEPRNFEMLMLAKLRQFDQKLKLLEKREVSSGCIIENTSFFQDSMLLDCECADQMSLDDRIEKANEILGRGGELQTSLYELFIAKYPPKL